MRDARNKALATSHLCSIISRSDAPDIAVVQATNRLKLTDDGHKRVI